LAVVFFAVDFLAADRFAVLFFADDRLEADVFEAEDRFAVAFPRTFELCRLAAEATFCATLGALSLIALPTCGARRETESPAARITFPTRGGVLEASFLAASGAFLLTVRAIFGARSATALPTAGAFWAMSLTRSPSLSTGPLELFDVFAMP
jgi:hypothetical protein